jgi:putative transposase
VSCSVDHPERIQVHVDRDALQVLLHRPVDLSRLRTPVQAPQANAFYERLLSSLRRECLDFLIPFGEDHLRRILRVWGTHYNRGRPHSSLGPGLPEPSAGVPVAPITGHRLPRDARVVARPVLGGLHHEYGLVMKLAA